VEEKFANGRGGESESEDSQDGVDEDDDGELVTEDLDAQISATLQALRSKDPRVYDEKVTFYQPVDEETEEVEDGASTKRKEKAMTLKDYHTKNILEGRTGAEEDEDDGVPMTFAQEQGRRFHGCEAQVEV
jgi:protein KRI1